MTDLKDKHNEEVGLYGQTLNYKRFISETIIAVAIAKFKDSGPLFPLKLTKFAAL